MHIFIRTLPALGIRGILIAMTIDCFLCARFYGKHFTYIQTHYLKLVR